MNDEVPSEIWMQVDAFQHMMDCQYRLCKATEKVDALAGTVPVELFDAYAAVTTRLRDENVLKCAPYESNVYSRAKGRMLAILRKESDE